MLSSSMPKKNAFRIHSLKAIVALALAFGIGTSSSAQTNPNSPIQVTANMIDYQPQNNLAILTGKAEVIQDGYVIRSEKFRVTYFGAGTNSGEIEKVISDSETFYASQTEKVRGNSAVFDAKNHTIIFRGNVIATQGQNVITGEELVVNTETKHSIMKSSNGRVRAVFFPSQQTPK